MRCEETPTYSADYLSGALGGNARQQFESHLKSCPTCRAELDALTMIWRQLGDIPQLPANTTAMRARFETLWKEASSRSQISTWLRVHAYSRPILQACAAIVLLIVGIEIGRQTQPSMTSEIRQLEQEQRELRKTVILTLMQQPSASQRLEGVASSSELVHPGNEVVKALLDTLMHDPNVNVRLASIDALKRFSELETVRAAAVQALDTQPSPLVQMALIDFVVETHDRTAIDTLRRLSRDGTINPTVRARAAWGIDHIAPA